jgi:hypothetical protein
MDPNIQMDINSILKIIIMMILINILILNRYNEILN